MPTQTFRTTLSLPLLLSMLLAACAAEPVSVPADTATADEYRGTVYNWGLTRDQADWLNRSHSRPAGR